MPQISLTIDDQAVSIRKGATILQTAQAVGIHIPTLCNLKGLRPLGGCRVCLVELQGRSRPAPACATLAEAGMEITTASSRLQAIRRQIVELLLAERNHQCPVCVMNEKCELQDLARRLGIDHVRFTYLSPLLGMDVSHARFGIDHNRCILCRRCVRVCDEIEGAHTWDVCGRGSASLIISDLKQQWGESSTCTDCGKCVQACPTGALFEKGVVDTRKGVTDLEKLLKWRNRGRR